jgi:hypothetical protein
VSVLPQAAPESTHRATVPPAISFTDVPPSFSLGSQIALRCVRLPAAGALKATFSLTNSGGPIEQLSVSPSLPAEWVLDASGVAGVASAAGDYSLLVTASNAGGVSSAQLTFTVRRRVPALAYGPAAGSSPSRRSASPSVPDAL